MAHILLHQNGKFNLYSTIVDAPMFQESLTLDEMKEWYKEEYGKVGLDTFEQRLPRLLRLNTPQYIEQTVKRYLENNNMPFVDFLIEYM